MSSEVREKISSMLNNHNYALMTDECRDLSGTQQLSIVIRFVHDQYIDVIDYSNVVKEYFLGFVPLEEFDAATLTLKIVEFINKLNIPLRSCICLCFDQIVNLRNEKSFNQIYNRTKQFCDVNGIDLIQKYEIHCKTKISARFNDCFINLTLGRREKLSISTDFMYQIYFPVINCILVDVNGRFSSKTLSLMRSISTVYPESHFVLNIDDVDEFSRHIDADLSALKNEFIVIKSMFMSKFINDVIQFLNELIPFSTAFQQTLRMIKSSVTMTISQVT
ncbi:unnamed protein product [Rotaria magnacalcarata]|uniref:DUF4371 domain-containing protein n=2 Tax=Rotaria magnacalcarata TaxID=392030 RepID=A0A815KWQ1_9BILA|nr:unnamed protein product [Rotaria magnacalcarata]